jgi:hypothetical protein
VNGSSWQGISWERPTPAEPSAPITSPDAIPNGGKADGSIPQFGLGPAPRDQRQLGMEFRRILVGEPKDRSVWGTGLIPGDDIR